MADVFSLNNVSTAVPVKNVPINLQENQTPVHAIGTVSFVGSAHTAPIFTGKGYLHKVKINRANGGGRLATVLDGTVALAVLDFNTVGEHVFDTLIVNGLSLALDGAAASASLPDITVVFIQQ